MYFPKIQYFFFGSVSVPVSQNTIHFFYIVSVQTWSNTKFLDCIGRLLIRYKILLLYQWGSRSNTKILYHIKLSDTFLIQITDIYQKYRPDPRKIRFGSEDLRKLVGRVGRPLYGAAESESLRRHRTHPRPKVSNPTKYKRDNQTLFNEFSWYLSFLNYSFTARIQK